MGGCARIAGKTQPLEAGNFFLCVVFPAVSVAAWRRSRVAAGWTRLGSL